MSGAELRKMLEANLGPRKKGGVMSLSGITVEVTCSASKASVNLLRAGKPVADAEKLRVITTDFLATGGDSALADAMAEDPANVIDSGDPVREALVRVLAARKGTLRGDDPALFARDKRRIHVAGANSTRCPGNKD